MFGLGRKTRASFQLLLIAALLTAQIGTFAHALEHEPGTLQDQLCATCLVAQSIDGSCVGDSVSFQTDATRVGINIVPTFSLTSRSVQRVRQRGPPEII